MLLVTMQQFTIMGTLEALSLVEQSRALLQKPANYLVNTDKQYVYTMNEEHVSEIQRTLPDHTIIYIGGDRGSVFPVFLWGVTTTSYRSYKKTWTRRKKSLRISASSTTYRKSGFFCFSAFQAEFNIHWQQPQ